VATRKDREVDVLVLNYHDDDLPSEPAQVQLEIGDLPAQNIQAEIFRMDADHGNSFTAWKQMGSPQKPAAAQQRQLEESSRLEATSAKVITAGATATVDFALPRQGVYLVRLKW